MNSPDPHQVQAESDGPKRRKASIQIMVASLVLFAITWPLIYLLMQATIRYDLVGIFLYFSGPLPIIPAFFLLVGGVMYLCGR